jgi:hypothetical protein
MQGLVDCIKNSKNNLSYKSKFMKKILFEKYFPEKNLNFLVVYGPHLTLSQGRVFETAALEQWF